MPIGYQNPLVPIVRDSRGTIGRLQARETASVNLLNNSGVDLISGDIVVLDTTTDRAVDTTIHIGDANPLVVLTDTEAGEMVKCLRPYAGVAAVTCEGAAISPGDSIITTDTIKRGKVWEGEAIDGIVGIALESKAAGVTTTVAILVAGGAISADGSFTSITITDPSSGAVTATIESPAAGGCLRIPCVYTEVITLTDDPINESDTPVEISLLDYLGVRESWWGTYGDASYPIVSSVWEIQHNDGNTLRAQLYKYDATYTEETFFNIMYDGGGAVTENWFEVNFYEAVFNEDGLDRDFRIEGWASAYGENEEHLFFVDAENLRVGILTDAPNEALTVNGNIQLGDDDATRYIAFHHGASPKPGLRYNSATGTMQYSNDGLTWEDIGSGAASGIVYVQNPEPPTETGTIWVDLSPEFA